MNQAVAITPGQPGTARVEELDGPAGTGDVVVDGLLMGVCGTDAEIAAGEYGTAPAGAPFLVLGHESLGRVHEAPATSGLRSGELVVGIVRRPDPVPCRPCGLGSWDMCRNGQYTERGIKDLHGYGARQWRVEADFLVGVPETLGDAGVLVEPASVVAKAWAHIEAITARSPVRPRRALITGAGPIGLLAALLARQRDLEVHVLDRHVDGPKPDLVADLGATYHTTSVTEIPEPDVVVECTGAASLVHDVMGHTAPAGIVCLTGVSTAGRTRSVDVGGLNRSIVLENDVVFGSVNANLEHYLLAVSALEAADAAWLRRLLTRRVPLERWPEALEKQPDDVKVVVDLQA